MKHMNTPDICWMVGMMEGEATFTLQYLDKGIYPRIEIKSIDREVLERLQEVTGVGNISLDSRQEKNAHWSPCYTWKVTDAKNVLHLICTAVSFGFFSIHRQGQILDCVDACSDILNKKWVPRDCQNDLCCDQIPRGSHFNRKYCTSKCKWQVDRLGRKIGLR